MITGVTVTLPNGGRVVGDYLPHSGNLADFAVLWVHGFGSVRGGTKAAAVAAECARRGWAYAAFDFFGHGDTGGPMHELRVRQLQLELDAMASFLIERGHTRLGLVGSSMGGFASAWFTRRTPERVLGCVLLAPAFRFLDRRWERLSSEQQAEWKRTERFRVTNEWVDTEIGYGLIEERASVPYPELVGGWNTPTLIFHGLADDVVPAQDSISFLNDVSYPDVELRLWKAGDHRLTAYKDEIAAEAGRFFQRRLDENRIRG